MSPGPGPAGVLPRLRWLVAGLGLAALVAGCVLAPTATLAAARQNWPAFVLVSGLLARGLVARDDGRFDAAGDFLDGDIEVGGRLAEDVGGILAFRGHIVRPGGLESAAAEPGLAAAGVEPQRLLEVFNRLLALTGLKQGLP